MAHRELNTLEKAFVVQRIYRADRANDDEDKRKEDEAVMQEVFDCSPWSIAGLKAELTKRIQRRERDPGLLHKSEVPFARSYVGLAASEKEREALQGEVADLLRIDLPAIQRITQNTRLQSEAIIEGLDIPVNKELPFESLGEVPLLRGGAHADYDTPERDKIRQVWSNAIDQTIPRSMRERIMGLILPGKRCLDVPHYLRLGIPPRNIIGVENGDTVEPRIALAEFTFNAREHGITYHRDDLTRFLKNFRERLSFAVIDMTGQMCPTYLDIAANLPLSEQSVVIFNTWPRREHREYQDELKKMWLHSGLPEEEYSLERAREFCPAQINAGTAREENWYFGKKFIEGLPVTKEVQEMNIGNERMRHQKNLETVARPLLRSFAAAINEHGLLKGGKLNEAICEKVANLFLDMFMDVTFGDAHIERLEKHSYRSGIAETPFHTDIGVIKTPKKLYYEELNTAVEFFMQCVQRCLHLLDKEQSYAVDDVADRFKFAVMKGRQFVEMGKATRRDRLACLLDGSVIDFKPIHTFLNAAQSYNTLRLECKDGDWENQVAIGRREVT